MFKQLNRHKSTIVISVIIAVLACVSKIYAQSSGELKLANEYYENNELEKARTIYEKLSKNESLLPVIYKNYLATLTRLKDNDAAEKFIKKVIRNYGDINYQIDHYLLISANPASKTEKEFTNIVNEIKGSPPKVEKAAEYFSAHNRPEKAKEIYLSSRAFLKEKHLYTFSLAKAYHALNEDDLMINELLGFLKENPYSLESVKNALQGFISNDKDFDNLETNLYSKIQKDPDEISYNELLLWLNIQKKKFGKAFTQAKAIDKRNKAYGNKMIEVGKIALENKDYDNAIKYFEYASTEYPNGPHYYSAKNLLISTRQEKIKNTYPVDKPAIYSLINEYKDLLKKSGKNASTVDAIRNMAMLYAFYVDKDSALTFLEEALKYARPGDKITAQIKLDMGDIYLLKNEPWESTLLYSQAEKMQKDEPLGYEAKLKNAKLAYYGGEFQLAQEHLDVLKLATSREIANDAMDLSLFIQDNLAFDSTGEALKEYSKVDLLLFQNKEDEALFLLKNLQKKYPEHSLTDNIFYSEAKIYRQIGQYENAVAALEEIRKNFREDVLGDDALYTEALIYEENLKDKEKAMQLYYTLLTEYPGSIYGAEARKRYRLLRGDKVN